MLKHVLILFSMLFFHPDMLFAGGKCEIDAKASVGILEFTGKGCTISGTPKVEGGKVSGEFSVDLSKIDTGMDLRNEHMRDNYLEVKKFPKATLKLDPMPEAGGSWAGTMELHGVKKPIAGTATKTATGYDFKFQLNTEAFGIKQAEYKGIVIAKEIGISGSIDK